MPELSKLQKCIQACRAKFPESLDTDKSASDVNFQAYKKCSEDCQNSIFPVEQVDYFTGAGLSAEVIKACGDCSVTNLPPCVKCGGALLSKGLVSIGANLLIGGIILLGIYILFKDEVTPVVKGVTKVVTKGIV